MIRLVCPECDARLELVRQPPAAVSCPQCGSALSSAGSTTLAAPEPEQVVADRFQLRRPLGGGSCGDVWLAHDTIARRQVALKFLRTSENQDFWNSIAVKEGRALSRLSHPRIAALHDIAEWAGRPVLVTRYIDGVTLSEHVRKSAPTLRQRVELMRALLRPLEYAHGRGVVHRDLKPANVLVDTDGHPWLLDFGLAHVQWADYTIADGGALIGTPLYMSPEQARRDPDLTDPRLDVYAIGVMLYELLTTQTPFVGKPSGVMARKLHDEPLDPRRISLKATVGKAPTAALRSTVPGAVARGDAADQAGEAGAADFVVGDGEAVKAKAISRLIAGIDHRLAAIVLQCLEREPVARYADATAVAQELDRWLAGEPVQARRARFWPNLARLAWKHRRAAATAALVLVTLTAAAGAAAAMRLTRHAEVAAQVRQVLTARPGRFRDLTERLDPRDDLVQAYLLALRETAGADPVVRGRIELLLATPPTGWSDSFAEYVEKASADEFAVAADHLTGSGAAPLDTGFLAPLFAQPQREPSRRLRLATLLVAARPLDEPERDELLDVLAASVRQVRDRAELSAPHLQRLGPTLSIHAEPVLDRYQPLTVAGDVPEAVDTAVLLGAATAHQDDLLVELIDRSSSYQLARLIPLAASRSPQVLATLDPMATDVRRQAKRAVGLWAAEDPAAVERALQYDSDDPELRHSTMMLLGSRAVTAASLADWLYEHSDTDLGADERAAAVIHGLALALSAHEPSDLDDRELKRLVPQIRRWHRIDSHGGRHMAYEHLLRRWGHDDLVAETYADPATRGYREDFDWFLGPLGIPMVVVRPCRHVAQGVVVDVLARPVALRPDVPRRSVRVHRDYAIATREVSFADLAGSPGPAALGMVPPDSYLPDDPAFPFGVGSTAGLLDRLNGRDPERFPAWNRRNDEPLPRKRGVPALVKGAADDSLAPRLDMVTDWRLPLASEWLLAVGDGHRQSWCFWGPRTTGNRIDWPDQLRRLHCHRQAEGRRRTAPCATYWPNDTGLFDGYGNATELVRIDVPMPPAAGVPAAAEPFAAEGAEWWPSQRYDRRFCEAGCQSWHQKRAFRTDCLFRHVGDDNPEHEFIVGVRLARWVGDGPSDWQDRLPQVVSLTGRESHLGD